MSTLLSRKRHPWALTNILTVKIQSLPSKNVCKIGRILAEFLEAHDPGNDAVANAEAASCVMLVSLHGIDEYKDGDEEREPALPDMGPSSIDTCVDGPLPNIAKEVVVISFDHESMGW